MRRANASDSFVVNDSSSGSSFSELRLLKLHDDSSGLFASARCYNGGGGARVNGLLCFGAK